MLISKHKQTPKYYESDESDNIAKEIASDRKVNIDSITQKPGELNIFTRCSLETPASSTRTFLGK